MKQAKRLFAAMAALLVFGLLALPASAQSPVVASVDRDNVSTDDQVTLNVVIDAAMGQPEEPVLPALDGFRVLSAATGTQMSTVNGASSVQVIYQYVLQPLREGQLVIDPIAVTVDGQAYQTEPISIAVTQGTGQSGSGSSRGSASGMLGGLGNLPSLMGSGMDPFALLDQLSGAGGGMPMTTDPTLTAIEAPKDLVGQDYFVEASVDNANPYQGEQITYVVRLYQAVNSFAQVNYQPPSFTGFWSKQDSDQNQYRTQAGGRDYMVSELRTVLFPTMAGEANIEPARLTIPGSFFDQGAELFSQPVAVDIKALPAGAPASFHGAVGQFQIDAAVDKTVVKVGDTVTQQVRISGLGNLETLADPQWPDSPAWRAFDSKAQTSAASQGGKLGGTRTYSRVLMPTAPGTAGLPAIEFAYFDPIDSEYHTISTQALAVAVSPDPAAAQANQGSPAANGSGEEPAAPSGATGTFVKSAAAAAHPAIRPIKTASGARQAGPVPLALQPGYWLLWALPLFLLAAQYLVQRRQATLEANPALVRSRLAPREAKQALATARKHPDRAPGAAEQILTGYLAGKLNRPVAGLTRQELAEQLLGQGIDPELVSRTESCLLASQAARYAPGDSSEMGSALLAETEGIVLALEQQWNGGRS